MLAPLSPIFSLFQLPASTLSRRLQIVLSDIETPLVSGWQHGQGQDPFSTVFQKIGGRLCMSLWSGIRCGSDSTMFQAAKGEEALRADRLLPSRFTLAMKSGSHSCEVREETAL